MNKRYLYKYFFQNALHSFLFWLVIFIIIFEFALPFLLKIPAMIELSQSGKGKLIERMILEQLNLNLYIFGFFLAPALGIIAGRALVNREIEVLLTHRLSRKDLFISGFIFYGLFLFSIWLIFILLYLLVTYIFDHKITLDLVLKLIISIFGIMLPFLWVSFFSLNAKPIPVILLYLVVYLSVPPLSEYFEHPNSSGLEKFFAGASKVISIVIPQTQPFQLIASPFSAVDKMGAQYTLFKWFVYGILWSLFLLVSGFLIYQRKDLIPHQT